MAPVDPEQQGHREAVHAFDYIECNFHLGGRPTRARIKQLHRHWFETGIPVAIELDRSVAAVATAAQ